jgi:predicted CXXCH cytochrome family protein
MKTSFSGNAQRKLCTVLAGGAILMLMSSFAAASISSTRHNLGNTNVAPNHADGSVANEFSGTGEICVFCHTPHGGDNTAAVPIWNRRLSNPAQFLRYSTVGTATFDAAEAPIGSVSIACLSCHDGTQAMNVMINTPGSGTVTTMGGTWVGGNVTAGGIMQNPGALSFPNLGSDLQNDHPVSMQYGGGGISNNTLTATTNDVDFAQAVNSSSPLARVGQTIGQVGTRVLGAGKRVWWVETDGLPGQSKLDMTLYSRTDGSGGSNPGVNQPFVECASCHDPHSNNTTFLRVDNVGSAVCLTCHNK